MSTLTTNQIKSRLKSAGFKHSDIQVSQRRSWIVVKLKDYRLDAALARAALKDLDTSKNVSHDWDPIWTGTHLNIDYNAEPDKALVDWIRSQLKDYSEFNVQNYNDVKRAAHDFHRSPHPEYRHLSAMIWTDLIDRYGGAL